MTSLDFLYIALGGGFVFLVIFLCVMLLNLTLILRDVSKMTANFRAVSDKIHESILDPMKTLSEMTAGFGFLHELVEKIRARFYNEESESEDDKEEVSGKDKRGLFSVKKLRK